MAKPAIKLSYRLPKGVRGIRYVKNHHYLELEDEKGRGVHLPAQSIMRHHCQACQSKWWSESNNCAFCPACGSNNVHKAWGRLQVAFVPDEESDFNSDGQDPHEIKTDPSLVFLELVSHSTDTADQESYSLTTDLE